LDGEKTNSIRRVAHSIVNLGPVKTFLTENRWFAKQYFQYMYAKPDPYRADNDFEMARYKRAFSLVAGSRFKKALEIGCGEGVNTWRIAKISEYVLATDLSKNAIRRAAARNKDDNVQFCTLDIVSETLDDRFDYLFCAETLYYVSLRQMSAVADKMVSLLVPGGIMHLMHYRSARDDGAGLELKQYGARTIHDLFIRHPALEVVKDELTALDRNTLLNKRAA
jgi:2-polyprenyl-3-methyl-5-hydroxy-6-metoxy-1,4-benzoquinol methylase